MSLTTGLKLLLTIQSVLLAQAGAEAQPEMPLRYYLIDMGQLDGPLSYQDWGIDNEGNILGFHKRIVLPDGSPAGITTLEGTEEPPKPPIEGGGSLWIDQNGNGLPDPDHTDEDGKEIVERTDIGVESGQPGVVVTDISDSRHVAGLAYDEDFKLHLARWTFDKENVSQLALWPVHGPESSGWVSINNHGDILDSHFMLWPLSGAATDLTETLRQKLPPEPAEPYYGLIHSLHFNDDQCILFAASKYIDGELKDSYFYTYSNSGQLSCTDISAMGTGLINNRGQMALTSFSKKTTTIRFPDGTTVQTTQDLPDIVLVDPGDSAGGSSPEVIGLGIMLNWYDLNDQGCLVGYREDVSIFETKLTPYIWTKPYELVNLNDLMLGKPQDVAVTHAVKINNYGQIVALGKRAGVNHAFLLSPRLGLDRWWTMAGGQAPLEVNWTVQVRGEPTGTVPCELAVTAEDPWALADGATVTVIPVGMDQVGGSIPFTDRSADLGDLTPGLYVLKISGFAVPAQPTICKVEFHLHGADEHLSAYFVADRRATPFDGQIAGSELTGLAAAYSPVIHLEKEEDFRPVPVEATWGPEDLAFCDNASWCEGMPVWGDVTQQMNLSRHGPDPAHNPRCSCGAAEQPSASCDLAQYPPTVYAAIIREDTRIAINYYFHYARSNWSEHEGRNTHEGDWEGITVFLVWNGEQYVPTKVAYAQHIKSAVPGIAGGIAIPWWRLNTWEGRPRVYVGLGGHASYPHAGETSWLGAMESHRGDGHIFLQYPVIPLPRAGDLEADSEWDWLLYPGHWGRLDIGGILGVGDDGPPGPVFLDIATGFPPGLRWFDPWAWADLLLQAN